MPDRPLDDLDHLHPPPSPGFADAVIAAGRRRVRRGRAAAAAAATVVVALAVPVAVELARTDSAAPAVSPAGPAAVPLDRAAPSGPVSGAADATVAVTAAVIGHLATSGREVRAVEVGDAFCPDADQPDAWACTGARPVTAAMQRRILAQLAARPPVRFVATPRQGPQGSSGPSGTMLFLTLGPARVTGRSAEQFVRSWCGFDCLRGERYVLSLRSGRWQVTGSFGGYVS